MATVVYVRERTRRRGEVRDDARTYERSWYVYQKTDGELDELDFDDVYDIINPTYVAIGDTFPGLDGVECASIELEQEDSQEIWIAIARYETPEPADEEPPDDFNEFMVRSQTDSQTESFGPRRAGGGQVIEEYVAQDLDGNPVVNTANDPFDEPLSQPVTIQVDTITVNEREKPDTARIGTADGYRLLANITYSEAEHVNKSTGVRTRYFVNTYEVWTHPFREWAWAIVLNRGYRERINANGQITMKVIRDEFGEPVNTPVPLNLAGEKIEDGGQPITVQFRIRNQGPLEVPFLD